MGGGGAERVTANLVNYWANKGWDITIVTLASQSVDSYELNPTVKRIALEMDGDSSNALIGLIQNMRRIFAVRRVLRQIQPDVALAMLTTANILLAFASWRMTKIRTVGSERTHPPQYPLNVAWQWLRKYSYGHLNAMVALTNEGADWIKKNTSANRVVVIPNPVNWPLANQLPHLDVKKVYRAQRYILLAVGRLSDEKQFSLLINCFQSLAERYSDWDLVILGEGPLRPVLEAQVQVADLANRVFLPGRVGNVGEWYEHADLYVMSSRFEGFPNTLAEALAYGLPAVSFDCDTGPRDLIRHKVDGLLVLPNKVDGLADALDLLMGDPTLRQRFAVRAVDVRERYATEQVLDQWVNLFNILKND